MALIRALGYHIKPFDMEKNFKNFFEQYNEFAHRFDIIRKGFSCDIWTKRIVLPPVSPEYFDSPARYVDLVEKIVREVKVDFVALPFSESTFSKDKTFIGEMLEENKSIVSSVKVAELGEVLSETKIIDVTDLLFEIANAAGPEGCTRFALAYGEQPETAYFPDAASRREGFSITLRYVSDLMEKIGPESNQEEIVASCSAILKYFDKLARRVSKMSETPYLGIDPSLSPWMEESVASLASKMLNDEFGNPGTYDVLNKLNIALEKASSEINALGFGEVMLPVAEDDLLKNLCKSGKMRLQQLVSMISICVAGLDMVAISLSTPRERVRRLLSDTFAVAYRKGKPVGVRLLLVPSNPGSEIEVSRFGKIPVLQV